MTKFGQSQTCMIKQVYDFVQIFTLSSNLLLELSVQIFTLLRGREVYKLVHSC